jgi:hypothetical protein
LSGGLRIAEPHYAAHDGVRVFTGIEDMIFLLKYDFGRKSNQSQIRDAGCLSDRSTETGTEHSGSRTRPCGRIGFHTFSRTALFLTIFRSIINAVFVAVSILTIWSLLPPLKTPDADGERIRRIAHKGIPTQVTI